MSENPAFSYEPLAAKEVVHKKLEKLVSRNNLPARKLFEAVADVITSVTGEFDPDDVNQLEAKCKRGNPLILKYGTSAVDEGEIFSQAWGDDYHIDLIENFGITKAYSHRGSGIYRLTQPQRIILVEDLQHVLAYSPS